MEPLLTTANRSLFSGKPILEERLGIGVVRDDLYPGGTKARFLPFVFERTEEIVFASACQGGAQFSLAFIARELGKKVTLFVAKRNVPHPRKLQAQALGARYVELRNGRLSNIQAKAREYAAEHGALLLPLGLNAPEAIPAIAEAARSLDESPDEVWCAAGSGTLCRALMSAWPRAHHFAVAVGRDLAIEGAKVYRYPKPFEAHALTRPPFPSDPHYEAKAFEYALIHRTKGKRVIFWNVLGPAPE